METSAKITESVSDGMKHISEIVKERLFSPMYFYFLIAWVITNWKFSYALLFVGEDGLDIKKIDYLVGFYHETNVYGYIWNIFQLLLIPAFSAYIVIWWLSYVSEKFYEKNERHKLELEVIKRKLDYENRARLQNEEQKVRTKVYDEKEMKYEDNNEFNEYLDNFDPDLVVHGIPMRASEVLYNTDYQAYKDELQDWIDTQVDSHLESQAEIARGK